MKGPNTVDNSRQAFVDKRIYVHISSRAGTSKAAELIRLFGGQVEQFIEKGVYYILTDIDESQWPPMGNDPDLRKALNNGLKIMSFRNLLRWCDQYINSQSSSDEDEETKATINELRQPFLKFEDIYCQYAPTVKEFTKWPEINLIAPLSIGKSIFNDSGSLSTPTQSTNNYVNHPNNSAQLTQQAGYIRPSTFYANSILASWASNHQPATPLTNSNIINGFKSIVPSSMPSPKIVPPKSSQLNLAQQPQTPNIVRSQTPNNVQTKTPYNSLHLQQQQRPGKRKQVVYCEICNQRIPTSQLNEHLSSQLHRTNTDKMDWKDVHSVINSLTSLSALNSKRISTTMTPSTNSEHQEFFCLHKVESVSQIFFTSKEQSISPIVDRQVVRLEVGR